MTQFIDQYFTHNDMNVTLTTYSDKKIIYGLKVKK